MKKKTTVGISTVGRRPTVDRKLARPALSAGDRRPWCASGEAHLYYALAGPARLLQCRRDVGSQHSFITGNQVKSLGATVPIGIVPSRNH